MKKIALAGVALVALAAFPAAAQQPQGPDGRARLAEPMTRAAVAAKVQARFARADVNRDGFVTQEEAQASRQAMRGDRQGMRGERGDRRADRMGNGEGRGRLFERLDANHDGSISRAEFDAGAQAREARREQRGDRFAGRRGPRGEGMRGGHGGFGGRGFAMIDANHDGRVSLQEAQTRALEAFDRADANRDGTVTPEERQAARAAMRARMGERRRG